MKYSDSAAKIIAADLCGLVKSRAQFARDIVNISALDELIQNNPEAQKKLIEIQEKLKTAGNIDCGVVCTFDSEFPVVNAKASKGERPYILFYRGNFDLLQDLNRIVAVIGVLNPEEKTVARERKAVQSLVKKSLAILSGLAKGCDTVAHETCLELAGKTIAILPGTLNRIIPDENTQLAEKIVAQGGLLLTEYYQEPDNRFEATQRFVDRDRLQALFAKAVILSASYRKNEGDSGSRHAMEYARKYGISRYMIYNEKIDSSNPQYGLNSDYFMSSSGVEVLTPSAVETLTALQNPLLTQSSKVAPEEKQLSFLE